MCFSSQKCVKDKARQSIMAVKKVSKEEADAAIDRVFDRYELSSLRVVSRALFPSQLHQHICVCVISRKERKDNVFQYVLCCLLVLQMLW